MRTEEMWAQFAQARAMTNESYDAWAFGGAPDELARLVLQGEKTATSSAYDIYRVKNQPLPRVGEYSVILDSKREAVCIIRTTNVQILPFGEIGEQHARKEGEGDKSLAYWRKLHQDFFTAALQKVGLSFDESRKVVCEEFEVVYP